MPARLQTIAWHTWMPRPGLTSSGFLAHNGTTRSGSDSASGFPITNGDNHDF